MADNGDRRIKVRDACMTCTVRWKNFGGRCDAAMSNAGLKQSAEAEEKLLSNGNGNGGVTVLPAAAAAAANNRSNLPVPRLQTRRRSSGSILSSLNFTKNGRVKTGHVFSRYGILASLSVRFNGVSD